MDSRDERGLAIAEEIAAGVRARADAADRVGKMPEEDAAALKTSGYLGFNVPGAYGGLDMSPLGVVDAQMVLAAASGSTALVAAMTLQVFGNARDLEQWPDDVAERFGRAVAAGGMFNSVASEPELGSPSRGAFFKTTAVEKDGGFAVTGRKTLTTGGRHLTHMLVRATVGDKPAVLLIEGNRDGIEWLDTWGDGLSLRASESHDVCFHATWVPKENLIETKKGTGERGPWFPTTLGATYLGIAMASRNDLVRYALERTPTALGKPIATLPKVQREIGEIDTQLQAAQALLREVARDWENRSYRRIAAAKQFAVETAAQVTDQALRVAGGRSLSRELSLERYFRDVRAGFMSPPSGDTAYEAIGEELLGEVPE